MASTAAPLIDSLRMVLADFEGVAVSSLEVDTHALVFLSHTREPRGPFVNCLRVGVSVNHHADALALARRLRLGDPTITAGTYGGIHLTWDGWVHTDTPAAGVVSVHLLTFAADITAQTPAQALAGVA